MLLPLLILAMALTAQAGQPAAFDHQHAQWSQLLQTHVRWINNGVASQVDYTGFRHERAAFDNYLNSLSRVTNDEFEEWPRKQQLAFLINAYNAFTIELIIDHWPVQSIRAIGGLFNNPWKLAFFTLLGKPRHLDWIEHEMIRQPGRFDEPRIHFAVNCAAIGCPALRTEAYVGDRLNDQLEDQTRRFLSDASRNRYREGRFELSSLFKWYREDFQQGVDSLAAFIAPYADLLDASPSNKDGNNHKRTAIRFLDYNWALNETR